MGNRGYSKLELMRRLHYTCYPLKFVISEVIAALCWLAGYLLPFLPMFQLYITSIIK